MRRKFVGPGQEHAVINILSNIYINSSSYVIKKGGYRDCETVLEITASEEKIVKLEKALAKLGYS